MFWKFTLTLCFFIYDVLAARNRLRCHWWHLISCENWVVRGCHAGLPTLFQVESTCSAGSGISLSARLTSSLYGPLQWIVSKVYLPSEEDYESIHEFDFTGTSLLGRSHFMRKTQFRNMAVRVAKVAVDVREREREREREKSKNKGGAHAMTSAVVDETLNLFLESAPNYLKFVCWNHIPYYVQIEDCKRLGLFSLIGCFQSA